MEYFLKNFVEVRDHLHRISVVRTKKRIYKREGPKSYPFLIRTGMVLQDRTSFPNPVLAEISQKKDPIKP